MRITKAKNDTASSRLFKNLFLALLVVVTANVAIYWNHLHALESESRGIHHHLDNDGRLSLSIDVDKSAEEHMRKEHEQKADKIEERLRPEIQTNQNGIEDAPDRVGNGAISNATNINKDQETNDQNYYYYYEEEADDKNEKNKQIPEGDQYVVPIEPTIPTLQTDEQKEGTQKLVRILTNAGISVDEELISKLPTWDEITSLYGHHPHVIGLDTSCAAFQNNISANRRYIAPAGLFNTGTNLLAKLLSQNCNIQTRDDDEEATHDDRHDEYQEEDQTRGEQESGMKWQVPWGKHSPPSWRLKHKAAVDGDIVQTNVLPVVVTKDPYAWMGSMCRHPYAAAWKSTKEHCPNLIPTQLDFVEGIVGLKGNFFAATNISNSSDVDTNTIPVKIFYNKTFSIQYRSLVDLWNDYYGEYYDVKDRYPRLIIRFEDLLFHAQEVVTKICHCGGGKMIGMESHNEKNSDSEKSNKYNLIMPKDSAKEGKNHGGSSNFLSSIVRYGTSKERLKGMTMNDMDYAEKVLRKDIMKAFSYSYPKYHIKTVEGVRQP